jgi:hypothetical protein
MDDLRGRFYFLPIAIQFMARPRSEVRAVHPKFVAIDLFNGLNTFDGL